MPFDPRDFHPPPSPPPGDPGPRRMSPREEKWLMWLIGGLLLGTLLLPIGGSSVLAAIAYLLAR